MLVPYRLERSARVKRMHMHVDNAQCVVLKMPLRQSEVRGLRFLEENGEWIHETLSSQPRVPCLQKYLMKNPRIALSGKWYQLEMGFRPGKCQYVICDEKRRVVMSMDPHGPSEEQMISLLRSLAREYLPERLKFHAGQIGVKVHGVTVRDQKCRWGSCSETGAISLNWRLVMITPKLQDHVLLHELAHLRHFDHSRGFYSFLKELDPLAEKHARQLDGAASQIINLGRRAS